MMLSKESIAAISDLIQIKLTMMSIGDRDDLREMVTLQRALAELQGADAGGSLGFKDYGDIPRRGRRRKVSDIIGEGDRT